MPVPRINIETSQRSFLAAYALVGNIREACRVAKTSISSVKRWLKEAAPSFIEQFQDARDEYIGILENEARIRAVQGTRMPVLHHGEVVMVWVNKVGDIVGAKDPTKVKQIPLIEHKKSDNLLMFLLKAENPGKYRDNTSVDITSQGKPVKAFIGIDTGAV